jgi:hypothetical protein
LSRPRGGSAFERALERVEPLGRSAARVGPELAASTSARYRVEQSAQACRSTSSFGLGDRLGRVQPLGQTLAQFMIVWQR